MKMLRFNFMKWPFIIFIFPILISCGDKDEGAPPPTELASLREGLVALYAFEGNADDQSTNKYDGSVSGAVLTQDRFGNANNAYQFDGENDFISYGNIEELSFGGFEPYTFSAWVKAEPSDTRITILSKWNGGVLAGWYLAVTANSTIFSYRNVAPWVTEPSSTIPLNEFVHLLTFYDGENLAIYINGKLSVLTPFRSQPHDKSTPFLIGALHSKSQVAGFFNGVIDDVRIYDRVLTEEEISWLANN